MAGGCTKQCRERVKAVFFGIFFSFIPLLVLTIKSLFRGRSVWSPKPRPNPPECLNDPVYGTHRYVKLKNIRLHYVEAGDSNKPLVIFLHGFPEFWYSWRNQIKALKSSYWTVAVDMRGYGDSDKPSDAKSYDNKLLVDDVKDLIHALGRSSCILISHDWGGVVAYMMAKRYPQMIEKMIVLNSPHPIAWIRLIRSSWKQFFKSWYIYVFQLPYVAERLMMADDLAVFDRMFRKAINDKSVIHDHDIEALKYTYASRESWTGPINYYRRLYLARDEIEKEMSGKISVPSIIIWGSNDIALEKELANISADYFVSCKVIFVEGASHFVQEDSPSIVNKHIVNFINGEK